MLTLGSLDGFVQAARGARAVSFSAYVLRRADSAQVIGALEDAGDRGAAVRVRLQGDVYGDDGTLAAENRAVVAELRRHHVDAALNSAPEALHLKAAVVDSKVFLDDRNWSEGGASTVLVSDDPGDVAAAAAAIGGRSQRGDGIATRKREALAAEARLIYAGRDGAVACESESFSFSSIYGALKKRAAAGARVRLLVAARDTGARSLRALRNLQRAGVDVRLGPDDEKMALSGSGAWVGSANATDGRPRTIDWGARSADPAIVDALRRRFEENWARGRPLALASGPAEEQLRVA